MLFALISQIILKNFFIKLHLYNKISFPIPADFISLRTISKDAFASLEVTLSGYLSFCKHSIQYLSSL
jgi:hypothetical protein